LFIPGKSVVVEERSTQREFMFRAIGPVTFNEAEDDIERLEGRVTIEEKRAGRTRRVDFRPIGTTGVKRIYKADGREQPLDAEGKRWLAEMIGSTLRELPLDTESRVRRMHARGGVAAVLSEIERTHSDHARRDYSERLAKLGPVDEKSLDRFIAAISQIHSEYELRSTLLAVMSSQKLAPAQQAAMLNVVAKMQSAFEQRSVIEALTPTLGTEPVVTGAWLSAVGKIRSDFEVRTLLEGMARRDALSPATSEMVLVATRKMESDFERATVLKAMVKHLAHSGESSRAEFFRSTNKVHSDFERCGVLTTLIEHGELDRDTYFPLFESIGAIQSNHERQVALLAAAKLMPRDQELAARYRQIASRLGDHERGQVEKALDRLKL